MFKFRDSIDSDIKDLEDIYKQTLTNKSMYIIYKNAYKHSYEPILHKIHLNDSFFNKFKTAKYMKRLNKLKDGYTFIVNQKKTIVGFEKVTLVLNDDDLTTYLENGVQTAYNTVEYFELIDEEGPNMNSLGKLSIMYESYSVWYKFLFKDDMGITIKDALHGQLVVYKMKK
jgi:hypothetical protein